MQNFSYINATSLEQVPTLLGRSWDDAVLMAGGTDLIGEMKDYSTVPKRVVNLKPIKALKIPVTLEEIKSHKDLQDIRGQILL